MLTMLKSCSSKKRYRTEGQAKAAAEKKLSEGVTLRWYSCCFCRKYHLTSRPSVVDSKERKKPRA